MWYEFLKRKKARKEKEREFLMTEDISFCPRCGETQKIWHTFKENDEEEYVIGMTCTHCFFTCGVDNVFTAIVCKICDIFLEIQKIIECGDCQ